LTDVVIFDRHLYRYFKGSYALEREVNTAFLYFLFFDKNAEHFVIFEKKNSRTMESATRTIIILKINKIPYFIDGYI